MCVVVISPHVRGSERPRVGQQSNPLLPLATLHGEPHCQGLFLTTKGIQMPLITIQGGRGGASSLLGLPCGAGQGTNLLAPPLPPSLLCMTPFHNDACVYVTQARKKIAREGMAAPPTYAGQEAWRRIRAFLPQEVQIRDDELPAEEVYEWEGHQVHLDRFVAMLL
jgi:hypothetical protein